MTFEEWYKSYDPFKNGTFESDLREAFKAGSDSKYFSIINKIQGDYFPSPKENTDD
jgi:hypothetical protein